LSVASGARLSETRRLATNGSPRVRVENDAGLVEVVAWERDEIEVTIEKYAPDERGLALLEVEVSGGPDEVLVTYGAGQALVDSWVDFKLKCPRATSLDLHNASGEVLVSGFYGASRVATSSGAIHAARMRGTATLTSASGAIAGAALEGTVYARSASGDLSFQGHMGGGHRLETASGGIAIDAVNGSVDARSASGSIEVVGQLTATSRVRTVSGDIRVHLLKGSRVRVEDAGRGTGDIVETNGVPVLLLQTTSGKIEVAEPD
jgi:hypothetical protein